MLLHPEIGQKFGMLIIRYQQVVALGTVIRDRYACLAGVVPVVATETSRRIGVTDVVRMRSPTNVHGWKDILIVDLHESVCGSFDLSLLGIPNGRIL